MSPLSASLIFEVRERIDAFVAFISSVTELHGYQCDAEMHSRLGDIDTASRRGSTQMRQELMDYCFQTTASELDQSVVHARGRNKPLGYAGDFLSIDLTYQRWAESPGRGRMWDLFYHRQDAPRAVCERKARFGHFLSMLARERRSVIRLLNVASGPCREILDGVKAAGLTPDQIDADCVELEPAAIEYAKGILGPDLCRSIRFHEQNALRYRPERTYDFVWSAGLFDYLNPRLAARLLGRLWQAVAPGGLLVIGNFAETHRTRAYIEWCGAWHLEHRSESDMQAVAETAAIPRQSILHDIDELGAIRYLIARRAE
ncbi:MAG: class I SAM-dependent methyltransferase [Planctomycetes bacterium]|nr:class I SAM-dependent methyltransferase [Planctomycetota bacterium]